MITDLKFVQSTNSLETSPNSPKLSMLLGKYLSNGYVLGADFELTRKPGVSYFELTGPNAERVARYPYDDSAATPLYFDVTRLTLSFYVDASTCLKLQEVSTLTTNGVHVKGTRSSGINYSLHVLDNIDVDGYKVILTVRDGELVPLLDAIRYSGAEVGVPYIIKEYVLQALLGIRYSEDMFKFGKDKPLGRSLASKVEYVVRKMLDKHIEVAGDGYNVSDAYKLEIGDVFKTLDILQSQYTNIGDFIPAVETRGADLLTSKPKKVKSIKPTNKVLNEVEQDSTENSPIADLIF